ncbi:hypothetical protein PAPYR_5841 [Paratrimastix pyriformis]|uniref:Uncharacterized protein n=1 Tax=Paratrimastix pyriformis TaxID=342808 RepID=A0ABQ8UJP6_9EUKA|nr:hypothetical protein PAPYR_5841 [Paratrimastix pyriformis]
MDIPSEWVFQQLTAYFQRFGLSSQQQKMLSEISREKALRLVEKGSHIAVYLSRGTVLSSSGLVFIPGAGHCMMKVSYPSRTFSEMPQESTQNVFQYGEHFFAPSFETSDTLSSSWKRTLVGGRQLVSGEAPEVFATDSFFLLLPRETNNLYYLETAQAASWKCVFLEWIRQKISVIWGDQLLIFEQPIRRIRALDLHSLHVETIPVSTYEDNIFSQVIVSQQTAFFFNFAQASPMLLMHMVDSAGRVQIHGNQQLFPFELVPYDSCDRPEPVPDPKVVLVSTPTPRLVCYGGSPFVFVCDLATPNQWVARRSTGDLPAVTQHQLVSLGDGRVLCIGGRPIGTGPTGMWVLDVGAATWTRLPTDPGAPPPELLVGHRCTVSRNTMYCYHPDHSDTLYSLGLEELRMTLPPAIPPPQPSTAVVQQPSPAATPSPAPPASSPAASSIDVPALRQRTAERLGSVLQSNMAMPEEVSHWWGTFSNDSNNLLFDVMMEPDQVFFCALLLEALQERVTAWVDKTVVSQAAEIMLRECGVPPDEEYFLPWLSELSGKTFTMPATLCEDLLTASYTHDGVEVQLAPVVRNSPQFQEWWSQASKLLVRLRLEARPYQLRFFPRGTRYDPATMEIRDGVLRGVGLQVDETILPALFGIARLPLAKAAVKTCLPPR